MKVIEGKDSRKRWDGGERMKVNAVSIALIEERDESFALMSSHNDTLEEFLFHDRGQ